MDHIPHIWEEHTGRVYAVVPKGFMGSRYERIVECDESRTPLAAAVRKAVKAWEDALPENPVERALVLMRQAREEVERTDNRVREEASRVAEDGCSGSMDLIDLHEAIERYDQAHDRLSRLVEAARLVLPEAAYRWMHRGAS